MRSTKQTYEEVAKRCSSYTRTSDNAFKNVNTDNISCLNCEHFAADEHCVLDLYDPIVKNLK